MKNKRISISSDERDTAKRTLTKPQALTICVLLALAIIFTLIFGTGFFLAVIGIIITTYVFVFGFKSLAVFHSRTSDDIVITENELYDLEDKELPRYSILIPLYKEARIFESLIRNLQQLDYPTNRLQILLLIERDDDETLNAVKSISLPPHFKSVLIPLSDPRTKPKACNIGLAMATGEHCVIYDAEDRPDPDQLKKAVASFGKLGNDVACIQARLQFWNPDTNLLTKFFAGEYVTYFNLVLPGIAKLGFPVPLGGSSNHFRLETLRRLGGWDAFNVTEDLDLGMWLARCGLRVRMMNSVTWEEATTRTSSWIKQRSRWIKGHMQTYLVHMRSPQRLLNELGITNFFGFQIIVGATPIVLLVNPLFWATNIAYAVGSYTWIESLFPKSILYPAVASMVFGNFIFMYYVMLGCVIGGQYRNVKFMIFAPLYWVLMSIAAWRALFQLLLRPHHWEKTEHGLVLPEVPNR